MISALGRLAVITASITVAAILLIACGSSPTLDTGEVVEKVYDDPDDWYQPGHTIYGTQNCSGGYNGQPQVCTRSPDIHIPGQWHHEGERFLLKLEGPDKDGKTIEDTRNVPESFWNEVRTGQWGGIKAMEIIER